MTDQPGLASVKNIVLVLSGKGGVGKSSTTLQLALALSLSSPTIKIGILDIDLTGPNIPHLLSIPHGSRIIQTAHGWSSIRAIPASATHGSVECMSLSFLLPEADRDKSIVWRGPKKTAMVRQFLSEVAWTPGLDYLLVDTPPGTSDEHISLVEALYKNPDTHPKGAVLVTTPQAVGTADVRKELNFCVKVGVRVLGVIENMSGFMCPCCGVVTEVFSKGGGERLARETGVEFWGGVPLDGGLVGLVEKREGGGVGLLERYKGCGLRWVFEGIVGKLVESVKEDPGGRRVSMSM
ncbi:P-loop containing nucleoside triphosphate hydrolase protein [Terfezia boudieri ATCC MYA-4762]|uniref:P-loop containing nucleoside triphosphate hydrolase protein n=1 Tax=Terfezia boudieri ATCC MYA-4762 TaxID=1051890 RepID=A0A3N4LNY0_9PEZI|nr:P-loop containing nucleoside triphosphate hydrolase protein [Terfezia boudieri ATCC MYA-4762]